MSDDVLGFQTEYGKQSPPPPELAKAFIILRSAQFWGEGLSQCTQPFRTPSSSSGPAERGFLASNSGTSGPRPIVGLLPAPSLVAVQSKASSRVSAPLLVPRTDVNLRGALYGQSGWPRVRGLHLAHAHLQSYRDAPSPGPFWPILGSRSWSRGLGEEGSLVSWLRFGRGHANPLSAGISAAGRMGQ